MRRQLVAFAETAGLRYRHVMRSCMLHVYFETILIHLTFNFVFSWVVQSSILKIPPKYLFTSVLLRLIRNPRIQVSRNMSIVMKPQIVMPIKLNDFTLYAILGK